MSSFNETNLKIQINFETINFVDQKKNILKQKTSSFLNVENKHEELKAISKIKQKNKFVTKIERKINIKK